MNYTVVLADKVQSENPISLLKLVELDQLFVYNRTRYELIGDNAGSFAWNFLEFNGLPD